MDRHAANAARDDSKPPQVKKWILTILMTETAATFLNLSAFFHLFHFFDITLSKLFAITSLDKAILHFAIHTRSDYANTSKKRQ